MNGYHFLSTLAYCLQFLQTRPKWKYKHWVSFQTWQSWEFPFIEFGVFLHASFLVCSPFFLPRSPVLPYNMRKGKRERKMEGLGEDQIPQLSFYPPPQICNLFSCKKIQPPQAFKIFHARCLMFYRQFKKEKREKQYTEKNWRNPEVFKVFLETPWHLQWQPPLPAAIRMARSDSMPESFSFRRFHVS